MHSEHTVILIRVSEDKLYQYIMKSIPRSVLYYIYTLTNFFMTLYSQLELPHLTDFLSCSQLYIIETEDFDSIEYVRCIISFLFLESLIHTPCQHRRKYYMRLGKGKILISERKVSAHLHCHSVMLKVAIFFRQIITHLLSEKFGLQ